MLQMALNRYSTSSCKSDCVEYWNGILSAEFAGKTISPVDPDSFDAKITSLHNCEGPFFAEAWSTAAHIAHENSHVQRQSTNEYILHYQFEGESLNEQDGREALLRPGAFTFCDTGRPYSVHCSNFARVLVLRLPRSKLLQQFGPIDDLVARAIDPENDAGKFFSHFIANFRAQTIGGDWHYADEALEDVMVNLLLMAFRPMIADRSPNRSQQVRRWSEAVQFIKAYLDDPELSVSAIAENSRISARSVQMLFARNGETVTSYIQAQRLERAARLLANPAHADKGIIQLCFDCGYTDLSYFTKQFKHRYGVPPARYRQARLSGMPRGHSRAPESAAI